MTFDLVIQGGTVLDGVHDRPYRADVGIRGEAVAAVADLAAAEAGRRLPAEGALVLPGFVDAHVHAEGMLFTDRVHLPALRQGVTTYVLGQDGTGLAPGGRSTREYTRRYFSAVDGDPGKALDDVRSVGDFLACFDGLSTVNVCTLVPNGNLRLEVVGLRPGPADEGEIVQMRRWLEAGLADGAVGMSSGLSYIPSRYAGTDELTALCRSLGGGGVYVTHMRGQGHDAARGVREVIDIATSSGCAAHISHYFGPRALTVPLLREAERADVDLTFDSYPYTAGSSILAMVALPPWVQNGGPDATVRRLRDDRVRARLAAEWAESGVERFEHIRLAHVGAPEDGWAAGRTIAAAARAAGKDLPRFICDLLVRSDLDVSVVAFRRGETEEDVRALAREPGHVVGSDGIFVGDAPHPRGWGAVARFLARHTRELGDWSIGEAVRHLTTNAARRFGLSGRGTLRPGGAADLVVLVLEAVRDRATYDEPRVLADGVRHVVVNGEPVLVDGRPTGATPGRGLRRS